MKLPVKILIVLALAAAIGAVLYVKQQHGDAPVEETTPVTSSVPENTAEAAAAPVINPPETAAAMQEAAAEKKLPKLLDLGADKCVPCKMMAPILEELEKEYAGKIEVQFIDVWKHPDAAEAHGVQMIPTQIFFDVSGKECFRHTGFFSREDILAKWKELGML